MNIPHRSLAKAAAALVLPLAAQLAAAPPADERLAEVPATLREWSAWATWNDRARGCPTPCNDPKKPLCHWPSRLALEVNPAGGGFILPVTVFAESWVRLPGGAETWPLEVTADTTPVPVVEHQGGPAVKLQPGRHELRGSFRWREVPQRIALPAEIGILALTLDGRPVEAPAWDANGFLWLKRDASTEQAAKDYLATNLYAVIKDGIPMWLHTRVELIVSGKSREETVGSILPAGWKLAAVESPLPVALDQAGNMKAQVRAGKWLVRIDAYRLDHPSVIAFAPDAKPAAADQLVAFQAKPEFRLVEVTGIPSVDVSQTTFPEEWRQLPVYRWETRGAFRLEERMRGMGLQAPAGLRIDRELWLDEDGRAMSFRDRISGTMQRIWRLDAAEGQDLGSVRAAGEGQLITRNPQTGSAGIEVRSRALDLEATGRMPRHGGFPATGWRSDADQVGVTLNLPPGWRLFALFGADWVNGDWLTAWRLLDLFLLLIFTLAVLRMWGWSAAVLAFCAFGLAYHEPGAPRYTWLALLIPLALLRVVPAGWGRRLLTGWKWLNVLALVLLLVPFVARQVQQCLYPQLETSARFAARPPIQIIASDSGALASVRQLDSSIQQDVQAGELAPKLALQKSANLRYDAKAAIQVGEGVPDWTWRTV
ncbi:MAG: hypothetical protein MUF04_06985, partial [Akkermansiaceae bacterium]|nr:hypothetical protein [Akkermansiaceae bacterium]